MSRRALVNAVRDRIRSALSYANANCDVMFDGQPPPRCGQFFVSVWPGGRRGQSQDADMDELYDVNVTITHRVNGPFDRLGIDGLNKATAGLEARADAVRAVCHMDYTAMNNANTTIGATENGFIEPLRFRGDAGCRLVGGAWFHAAPEAQEVGLVIDLRFGDARRIQVIAEQS